MPTKSRIDNNKRCFICHTTQNLERHHVFNGGGHRSKSEADGLWVYLCKEHHEETHRDFEMRRKLKQIGEMVYEQQIGTRQEFRKRYGKYYIEGE